jgi:transposase
MFIREISKKNSSSDKIFVYHRLMESVRTPQGPRQKILLNLGKLEIPTDQWKTLANRIEEIYLGQQSFQMPPPHIEELARHYASLLINKEMLSIPAEVKSPEPDWETVDLNSISQQECRSIGGEAAGYNAFKKLGFPKILTDLDFNNEQIQQAGLLIIGRLLHPGSERETAMWGKEISALGELLGADFRTLSNNALYRLSDLLVEHHQEIEKIVAQNERQLFSLGEKIVLYDLTNTYLEGAGQTSNLAQHGRSKEKRKDCALLTLALVLDEDGFPKASRIFPGNVSEPRTLQEMLEAFKSTSRDEQLIFSDGRPTVVIDAGVATEANLQLIRQTGYHYVCVSRSRPQEIPTGGLIVIKEDDNCRLQVKKLDHHGEVLLYCESSGRSAKEEAIKSRMQKSFEEGLQSIVDSIQKKRGIKTLAKVMERLGRLREKYPTIAQFYRIEVEQHEGTVEKITWQVDEEEKLRIRFSGSYYIRTDRTDLEEKELWSLYTMLTNLEDAFRSMKSELGMRPAHHRLDRRLEGHLFITVLAYHLLASIQRELKNNGISYRWETIRTRLATQMRVTVALTNDKGERIYIRQTTDPEPFHLSIFRALGLSPKPLKSKRIKV